MANSHPHVYDHGAAIESGSWRSYVPDGVRPYIESAPLAALFLGIFITMIPALEILDARATSLNLRHPWQFFWLSGALSSFLDNAPTYLTFSAMASGLVGSRLEDLSTLLSSPLGERLLIAVSCGSVFMGANTYIGNGPNFMVKSIAERSGIQMPSFGRYEVVARVAEAVLERKRKASAGDEPGKARQGSGV